MASQISFQIVGDTKKLQSSLGDAQSKLGAFGSGLKSMAAVGATALLAIGAGAIGLAAKTTQMASDMQQSTGAVESIFGKFASEITSQAGAAATKFGLSGQVYQQTAALMGASLKNAGISMEDLSGTTNKWIGLAGDLSAAFGGTVPEATEAMTAALRGEFDQLEQYGIKLSEELVKTEMAAKGVSRAVAVESLVMAQAGGVVGQFARETGTLAHQQQVAGAALGTLGATIGQLFLPIAAKAMELFNAFLPSIQAWADALVTKAQPAIQGVTTWIQSLIDVFQKAGGGMSGLGAIFQKIFADISASLSGDGVSGFVTTILSWRESIMNAAMQAFNGLVQALPVIIPQVVTALVGGVTMLVQTLVAALPQLLQGAIQLLTALVTAVVQVLPMVVTALLGAIVSLATTLVGQLPTLLTAALELFASLVTAVVDVLPDIIVAILKLLPKLITTVVGMIPKLLQTAVKLFISIVEAVLTAIPEIIVALLELLPVLLTTIVDMIPDLLDAAIELFTSLVEALPKILPKLIIAIIKLIPKIVTTVIGLIPQLLAAAIKLFGAIVSAVPKILGSLGGAIRGLIGAVPGMIGAFGSALYNAGVDLIQGMINGVGAMGGALWDAAKRIASGFVEGVKSFLGIHSPSRLMRDVIGKNTILGLAKGLANTSPLDKAVRHVNDVIGGGLNSEYAIGLTGASSASLSGSGSHGGTVINNITVNAPVGSSPSDIGREIDKYLNAHYKLNGVR